MKSGSPARPGHLGHRAADVPAARALTALASHATRKVQDHCLAAILDLPIAELIQGPIEAGRTHLDLARVEHYVARWDDAASVTVFETDDGLLLADGYHRLAAAARLGRTTIRAAVREGRPHDALRFAVHLAREQQGLTEQEILAAIYRRGAWKPPS